LGEFAFEARRRDHEQVSGWGVARVGQRVWQAAASEDQLAVSGGGLLVA
jgi:hypothetical protein